MCNFRLGEMANLFRLLFCVVVAYGAVVEEEMNALLEDSCEGECTLSLLQTLGHSNMLQRSPKPKKKKLKDRLQ